MLKRGFACCVLLALASTAYGGVEIQLVPNPGPPYDGGESVIVDVLLVQTPAGEDRSLRMVQLDFTLTDVPNWGVGSDFWDFSSTPHCIDTPAGCGADHTIDEDKSAALPPAEKVFWIAFGSETELGENTDKQVILPGDGTPVTVLQLPVTVPNVDGHYKLDVMNGPSTDMDMRAQVHWGFGTNIGPSFEPLTVWRPGAGVTGESYDFCVGTGGDGVECTPPVNLIATIPACDVSLTRPSNNVMRLEFDGAITAPAPGEIEVRECLPGGGFGAVDLSGSLAYAVEGGTVLRISEDGAAVLANETWYGVTTTTGDWNNVLTFEVAYKVCFGDGNNSGFTNFADLSFINANFVDPTSDWDVNDINGSGFVNFADLSSAFANNDSTAPAKPDGHTCTIP